MLLHSNSHKIVNKAYFNIMRDVQNYGHLSETSTNINGHMITTYSLLHMLSNEKLSHPLHVLFELKQLLNVREMSGIYSLKMVLNDGKEDMTKSKRLTLYTMETEDGDLVNEYVSIYYDKFTDIVQGMNEQQMVNDPDDIDYYDIDDQDYSTDASLSDIVYLVNIIYEKDEYIEELQERIIGLETLLETYEELSDEAEAEDMEFSKRPDEPKTLYQFLVTWVRENEAGSTTSQCPIMLPNEQAVCDYYKERGVTVLETSVLFTKMSNGTVKLGYWQE